MNLYDSILFYESVIYKKVKARINDDSRLYFLLYLYCAFLVQPLSPLCFYGALFYLLPLK